MGTMPTYMETNKRGRVPKGTSKRRKRKDDDDDMSMATTFGDEIDSSGESTNEDADLSELEAVQIRKQPNIVPKRKKLSERIERKKKNRLSNPQVKMKKSKFEFAYEPMDVSENEEKGERMAKKCRKYRSNRHNLSKKLAALMTARMRRKNKAVLVKAKRKSKRIKPKAKSSKKVKRKGKSKNCSETESSPCPDNSTEENTRSEAEQKSTKQAVQKENNNGDNTNNFSNSNAENPANASGDSRNLKNEKSVTDEKKVTTAVNKEPGHADINSKASKEDTKNEPNKDSKAKEKAEDLSKKVDKKEVKGMDEGVTLTFRNPRYTRLMRSQHPEMEIERITSRELSNKASAFKKFYMTVHRELCNTHPVKAIAREAARRWKNITTEEKNKFYYRKRR